MAFYYECLLHSNCLWTKRHDIVCWKEWCAPCVKTGVKTGLISDAGSTNLDFYFGIQQKLTLDVEPGSMPIVQFAVPLVVISKKLFYEDQLH